MTTPLKMSVSEIPSYILSHLIEPFIEQCYLVSIEYRYVNLNKILVLLLKDCSHVNGAIHINLNNVVNNLIEKYKMFTVDRDWLVQDTVAVIRQKLQPYFYHLAEFSLSPPHY
jgi:pyruvate-formate lyase